MKPSLKKRFWSEVAVIAKGDGLTVTLDGHTIRTPSKADLIVPTRALADAIAEEWSKQEGEIDPLTMPTTRAANAALDKVANNRDAVIEMLVEYGDTDLILYRAERPPELQKRQTEKWDDLVAWAQGQFGISLTATAGIMPIEQSADCLDAYRRYLQAFDAFQLTGVHDLITLSGSFVIGAAVAENHLSVSEAWLAARVDEQWQQEQWGEDEDAVKAAEVKKADFVFALKLLNFCAQP